MIAQSQFQLRDYQQEAVDLTVKHFKLSNEPAIIVLPTGAGKSLVISELARIARGKVLVLAHVKELVEQNYQKFSSYGIKANIYSAGLFKKQTSESVTFGSVQSVSKSLKDFNNTTSLLIIDECHRVSTDKDTEYQKIIEHLKSSNPKLKILGLTATPYRLNQGWIYQIHRPKNEIKWIPSPNNPPPFFKECIYELTLSYMIQHQYLTPVKMLDAPIAHYDFDRLDDDNSDPQKIDQYLATKQRATKTIINQVLNHSKNRLGVMIFASTVDHAKEIYSYLPTNNSAIITGEMKNQVRDTIISSFKKQEIKYLVNVSVLTTGFDAPHVDVIAILRNTESLSLYQQIVGRGLRLYPDKKDCLVLDYSGNLFNIFSPNLSQPRPKGANQIVNVECPICGHINVFWGKMDEHQNLVEHYGRRCQGLIQTPLTQDDQCSFRFKYKLCPYCNSENDIAARVCQTCSKTLIDPDDKLKEALKLKGTMIIRCSGMTLDVKYNKKNQSYLQITYYDEDGAELKEFFHNHSVQLRKAFEINFIKLHLKPEHKQLKKTLNQFEDIIKYSVFFRHPDFVIARKEKNFWSIKEKIFDYEGNYRKAYQNY